MTKISMFAIFSMALAASSAGFAGGTGSPGANQCRQVFADSEMDAEGLGNFMKSKRYLKGDFDVVGVLNNIAANPEFAEVAFRDPAFLKAMQARVLALRAGEVNPFPQSPLLWLASVKHSLIRHHERGRALKNFSEIFEALSIFMTAKRGSPQFVEEIAAELAAGAGMIKTVHALPEYHVFKIIKENVRRQLGQKSKNLQDILVVRSPFDVSHVRVLVIANRSFEGQAEMPFGMSVGVLEVLPSSTPSFEREYKWRLKGLAPSKAVVKYEALPAESVIPPAESSPRYAEMLADGRLSGAVVIAKNMSDFAPELSKIYLDYFRAQGFAFKGPVRLSGSQASALLLGRVRDGRLDYLVREGHGEFAGESLVTWAADLQVYEGRRAGSRAEEDLLIIFPAKESGAVLKDHLGQAELGLALRARKQASQFVYFDTACSGAEGIAASIQGVGAVGFTPIGSANLMDTFTPSRGDAIFEFLRGIRTGQSWATIDKSIEKSEKLTLPNAGKDYLSSEARKNIHPFKLTVERGFPREI